MPGLANLKELKCQGIKIVVRNNCNFDDTFVVKNVKLIEHYKLFCLFVGAADGGVDETLKIATTVILLSSYLVDYLMKHSLKLFFTKRFVLN